MQLEQMMPSWTGLFIGRPNHLRIGRVVDIGIQVSDIVLHILALGSLRKGCRAVLEVPNADMVAMVAYAAVVPLPPNHGGQD